MRLEKDSDRLTCTEPRNSALSCGRKPSLPPKSCTLGTGTIAQSTSGYTSRRHVLPPESTGSPPARPTLSQLAWPASGRLTWFSNSVRLIVTVVVGRPSSTGVMRKVSTE